MRKTKIVCTIGPACSDEITLKKMCLAGMNVARLNFSHGTHEDHQKNVDMLKRIRQELNIPLAIMLDTKGPEYRVGTFKNGKEELSDGDTFTFTTCTDYCIGVNQFTHFAKGICHKFLYCLLFVHYFSPSGVAGVFLLFSII